jgi:hypothetical protein
VLSLCRDVFQQCYNRLPRKLPLKFALPGAERQDSVFNGFQQIDAAAQVGGWSRRSREEHGGALRLLIQRAGRGDCGAALCHQHRLAAATPALAPAAAPL